MSEKNIKIVLADDEELFRKGIYFLLQREPNIEIIFEAANGNQLMDFLKPALRASASVQNQSSPLYF